MTNPAFLMACASMAVANAGLFIYILAAPIFLMKHLGLRETQFLWLFLPVSIALVIGAWISGRFAGTISGIGTIYTGYGVMAVAAIGNLIYSLAGPAMVPWSIVPVFVYVAGMSIAMPSLTLMTLDLFPTQRGLAASCQGFISLGFNSIVSAFVAFIWGTPLSLAVAQMVFMIGAVGTVLLYVRAERKGV